MRVILTFAAFKRAARTGKNRCFVIPRKYGLDLTKEAEYLVMAVPKQMVPKEDAEAIEAGKRMVINLEKYC